MLALIHPAPHSIHLFQLVPLGHGLRRYQGDRLLLCAALNRDGHRLVGYLDGLRIVRGGGRLAAGVWFVGGGEEPYSSWI